jgi:two-component SAPR family response regulator
VLYGTYRVINTELQFFTNSKEKIGILDIKMPNIDRFELYQRIKDKDNKAKDCLMTVYEESLKDMKRFSQI